MQTESFEEVIGTLRRIDWGDIETVSQACQAALEGLAQDGKRLRAMMEQSRVDPRLRGLCESYDILDKIVLHDDDSGFRIRLHVFRAGYFDRPHNHRWPYTSRILAGSYRHTLFGTPRTRAFALPDLLPALVREERTGDSYTLDHRMVHAISAAPDTVTLILRGPSVVDEFFVGDRVTGEVWPQYGAASESPAVQNEKQMTDRRFAELLSLLEAKAVIA